MNKRVGCLCRQTPTRVRKRICVHRILPATLLVTLLISLLPPTPACGQSAKTNHAGSYVSSRNGAGRFALFASGRAAPLYVSSGDYPGVIRATRDLQSDIGLVSNLKPSLFTEIVPPAKSVVLVGTLGKSPIIDKLVQERKLDVGDVSGKWETYLLQVVEKPIPGIDRALIIAGSDKRGTMYGLYDLSAHIGVSPWCWWADVPVSRKSALYVLPGRHSAGEPAVKYRGIFINDEAPALSGWSREKFGGFNHLFYEKVFELILRLKGNFLWPAMWGSAFDDDDTLNPKLADEYGIVIGTSHHEPMMRAHDEWRRYGKGAWNYEQNDSALKAFWKQGIKRMDSYESVVTVGMRGDGDLPMSQEANISLLERIVKDQRTILGEVTGGDVTRIPQSWALYKEVQEYYDKGMRVPDDVTLLLCDDNWGNIRKLPKPGDKPRSGGYGIYYHYDYVGGPRNYKWLNTNQISRVWEQMHLAYETGVNRIWIVNVGDMKPMEFPISFFLDYAWNPGLWPAERLPDYTQHWAKQQFGEKYAADIANILTNYTKYNARRKPELLSPETYSLVNYREAETVVAHYNELAREAQRIYKSIPVGSRDAFFQLVLHPVLACSNLNELYVTVAKNRMHARQGRATTNALAAKAKELFIRDSLITYEYNHVLAKSKWNHMMDQTHIGYTYWQQPDYNSMPEVRTIEVPARAEMGVAIEGSTNWWPEEKAEAVLPEFDSYNRQTYYVDIFNRGKSAFAYSTQAGKSWIKVAPSKGRVESGKRLWVSVDWNRAPIGTRRDSIIILGPNKNQVVIYIVVNYSSLPKRKEADGFVEANGFVSIEAEHFSRSVGNPAITWQRIPGLGRTLSAMTPLPVTSLAQNPGGESPRLEYRMFLTGGDNVKIRAFLSPTLDFYNSGGLHYGISFDDESPQIINMHTGETNQMWERWVSANINVQTSQHHIDLPGWHVLKFWMVDPGVVLQKIVVETGSVKPSYLGPPESFHRSQSSHVHVVQ